MARGRDLKKEGKNFKEVFDIREAESEVGQTVYAKAAYVIICLFCEGRRI